MSYVDNILIQVRALLHSKHIKLWEEPYYVKNDGSVESEINHLSEKLAHGLSISWSDCKRAIVDLQNTALRNISSRKEFEETGMATFNVHHANSKEDNEKVFQVNALMKSLGQVLIDKIKEHLKINDARNLKCVAGGRILDTKMALVDQGLKNNQNLLVIVSENMENSSESMYNRIQKIIADVETIVDSNEDYVEIEDQHGNTISLPQEENRALLLAMSFCEKAYAAMRNSRYDEALVLLLEADEKFATCNSEILKNADNYALLNLNIVWCYLCLKNITQLPDAERRLEMCEVNFHRSYGENMDRAKMLSGDTPPERVLLMRLHLLQGVVLFHQNRRNEAYEKLLQATNELRNLKVDDNAVQILVEMGYQPSEARLALRSCSGILDQAVNYIHDRRERLDRARSQSNLDLKSKKNARNVSNKGNASYNPHAVRGLVEMGFDRDMIRVALEEANDINTAIDILQNLYESLVNPGTGDPELVRIRLGRMGFDDNTLRSMPGISSNDIQKALEHLVAEHFQGACGSTGASTSAHAIHDSFLRKMEQENALKEAFQRFNEDIADHESEYLGLSLNEEEQILIEYRSLLE